MNKELKNNYNRITESEKHKIQRQFHADDLNYLASFSFESGTLVKADVDEIYGKIDKKIGSKTNSWLNTFVLLVCGAFIGFSLFFIYYQNSLTHPSTYTVVEREKQPITESEILSKENTIKEELVKPVTKENFINSGLIQVEKAHELFDDAEIKDIIPMEVKTPELSTEENFVYIPNAPFIYIHNLKVADYAKLYFKDQRKIDLRDNGLSAEYSHKEDPNETTSSIYSEENYYAHEIIKDAMMAFNKKQYAHCIELLDLLSGINKDDINALFYKGMCYFNLNQNSMAIDYFDLVTNNKVNIFLEETEFFRALALKKSGKIEEAVKQLTRIKNQNLFYSQRAGEELKK